jgi:hypothetical protein
MKRNLKIMQLRSSSARNRKKRDPSRKYHNLTNRIFTASLREFPVTFDRRYFNGALCWKNGAKA